MTRLSFKEQILSKIRPNNYSIFTNVTPQPHCLIYVESPSLCNTSQPSRLPRDNNNLSSCQMSIFPSLLRSSV